MSEQTTARELLKEARDWVAIFADPPRLFQFSDGIRAADVDEARSLLARIDAAAAEGQGQ